MKNLKPDSRAALEMTIAVAHAIRDLGTIPSGHLYARLMGHLTLSDYEAIIQALKGTKLVSEAANVLKWEG